MQISGPKVAIYLGLIFGGGVATGVLSNMLYLSNTVSAKALPVANNDDWRKKYTEAMKTRLVMSDEQMKQLDDTLDETRVEYRLLRNHYKPEMEKIHQVQVQKIRKFLQSKQMPEFDRMEREREEKMRSRESGPGI